MFSCVFVTVTAVDQDLCWLGRDKKSLGTTCTFYHQHCSPNLYANFCNLGKLTFMFFVFFKMKTKKARNNSINGHWKTKVPVYQGAPVTNWH